VSTPRPIVVICVFEHGLNIDQSKPGNHTYDVLMAGHAYLKILARRETDNDLNGRLDERPADVLQKLKQPIAKDGSRKTLDPAGEPQMDRTVVLASGDVEIFR
jgi:hypothetical protein